MTRAEERRLLTICWHVVKPYEGNQDYSDILGETMLQAYQGYLKGLDLRSNNPLAMAARRAAWGPAEWFRRWQGNPSATLKRAAEFVQLEEIEWLPSTGHEDVIVEREWREWIWRESYEHWSERQRFVMDGVLRQGRTKRECAVLLGVSETRVGQIYREALERCRKALGV